MIDIADLDTPSPRRKCREAPKTLSLDEESSEFLAGRSDGSMPLLDAFYGQFLDPLPPARLKDFMRHIHTA